jgi:hypothetical protein
MKKIVLAALLVGSSYAVFAQTDTSVTNKTNTTNTTMDNGMNNTMMTTADYNAFSTYTATPPDYMHSYVLRDYPTAADLKWRQEGDWWHGYYLNNGMPSHVYYTTGGNTFTVALPVRQSWVPDDVVSKAVTLYGPMLYDINTVKGTNSQDIYTIRILENGQMSTVWMDANGNKALDVYRMETTSDNAAMGTGTTEVQTSTTTEVNTSTDMNMNNSKDTKTKIKVKNADGTETKTKMKDGKVKTKTGTQPLE